MSDYVLSATLELRDKFSAQVKKAKSGFTDFERSLRGTSAAVDNAAASMEKSGVAAVKLAQQADKAKASLSGLRGTYSATVRAKDEATQAVRRIKTELSGLQGKVYTAMVHIRQNGPLQQMKNGLSGMAGGMLMGTSMQMAGAAGIGFGVYDAIKGYMDFEQEMSAVKAISGATEQEFQQLTAKAQQMGADTKFSAFEAAQALEYMGMAGWKTNEMLNGLPGIMNLAAASGEDLAGVSDIVTDALSAFKLRASDAAMFSDVLAAAATNSNTNVGKMGYTFKYVAPLAGAMGYSIQDTALAIGAMADSGIKAETAGTSLRSILTRMAAPPKDAAEAMQQLGLSITRADGTMRPLRDIMRDLRTSFRSLTPDQQAATAAALAGQDAMSGLLAIVNESGDKWDKLADAIDNSRGAAEKMAKTRLDNLAGDIEYLSGDWDAFTMMLMEGKAASGLRGFVQEVDHVLTAFSESVQKNGLGVTSVLKGIGTAFSDLKDKALAMDGVGSILAGGALVVGLTKIVSLARRARGYLGDLAKPPSSSQGGGSGVGDMVVQARTVIVNGSTAPGIGGGTGGLPGKPSPAPTQPGTGSRAANLARRLARWGLPLTLLNGALDIAMVPEGQTGAAVGGTVGSTAGWLVGAKAGAAAGAGIGSLFGGVGAVPGAAIGGLVGGVAGSLGGGALGQRLGSLVDWDNEVTYASELLDRIAEKFHATTQGISDAYVDSCRSREAKDQEWDANVRAILDAFPSYIGGQMEAAQNFAVGCWDTIAVTAAEKNQQWADSFADAKNRAGQSLEELKTWAGSIWDSLTQGASEAASSISTKLSGAWDAMKGAGPSFSFDVGSIFDHNATGSTHFAGGWTEVNELGGEAIWLPNGSWIYPHATTERMLQKQLERVGSGGAPQVTISGNTFAVREEADINRIAYELLKLINTAHVNYGGA